MYQLRIIKLREQKQKNQSRFLSRTKKERTECITKYMRSSGTLYIANRPLLLGLCTKLRVLIYGICTMNTWRYSKVLGLDATERIGTCKIESNFHRVHNAIDPEIKRNEEINNWNRLCAYFYQFNYENQSNECIFGRN